MMFLGVQKGTKRSTGPNVNLLGTLAILANLIQKCKCGRGLGLAIFWRDLAALPLLYYIVIVVCSFVRDDPVHSVPFRAETESALAKIRSVPCQKIIRASLCMERTGFTHGPERIGTELSFNPGPYGSRRPKPPGIGVILVWAL